VLREDEVEAALPPGQACPSASFAASSFSKTPCACSRFIHVNCGSQLGIARRQAAIPLVVGLSTGDNGPPSLRPPSLRAAGGASVVRNKFSREVAAAGLAADGTPGPVVTEGDLAGLPEAAQRYLRFMRVVGRPRDTSFRAHLKARFRPRVDAGWVDAEIWQFNSQPDVARIFHMRLRMKGVPVYGRDTYVAGRGRMLIRPLDLFTVEDAQGFEYDVGELVTYLNDAVLIAPSMLLVPAVSWAPVDDRSFDLALTNRGTTVTARVFLDDEGAPRDFSTTDRFHGRVRTRWTTPVDGWTVVDGRPMATRGRGVWHFPQGELAYAEIAFQPGAVAFNVPSGA
jgi:hypothetical protein